MIFICFIYNTQSLYFYVTKEPRCFILDIPSDTDIKIIYESPDTSKENQIVMKVFPPDDDGNMHPKPILETFTTEKGQAPLHTKISGDHMVCVEIDQQRFVIPAEKKMKYSLQLAVGADAIDYESLAKKRHLDELEVAILKLSDRVKSIQKRQDYAKEKDEIFRDTSEHNNSLSMWVSIIQIGILALSAAYHVHHLKAYFHKKKLV